MNAARVSIISDLSTRLKRLQANVRTVRAQYPDYPYWSKFDVMMARVQRSLDQRQLGTASWVLDRAEFNLSRVWAKALAA